MPATSVVRRLFIALDFGDGLDRPKISPCGFALLIVTLPELPQSR
jgi:hypothetical protein